MTVSTMEFDVATIVITNDGQERINLIKELCVNMEKLGWKYLGDDLEVGRRVGPVNTPCPMFYRKKKK
jgi:hypothetical protein